MPPPRTPPGYRSGYINTPGGHVYRYGTGGSRGSRGPIPVGDYPMTPFDRGPIMARMQGLGINHQYIWDPAIQDYREGIGLHVGTDAQLRTLGCVAVDPSDWAAVRAAAMIPGARMDVAADGNISIYNPNESAPVLVTRAMDMPGTPAPPFSEPGALPGASGPNLPIDSGGAEVAGLFPGDTPTGLDVMGTSPNLQGILDGTASAQQQATNNGFLSFDSPNVAYTNTTIGTSARVDNNGFMSWDSPESFDVPSTHDYTYTPAPAEANSLPTNTYDQYTNAPDEPNALPTTVYDESSYITAPTEPNTLPTTVYDEGNPFAGATAEGDAGNITSNQTLADLATPQQQAEVRRAIAIPGSITEHNANLGSLDNILLGVGENSGQKYYNDGTGWKPLPEALNQGSPSFGLSGQYGTPLNAIPTARNPGFNQGYGQSISSQENAKLMGFISNDRGSAPYRFQIDMASDVNLNPGAHSLRRDEFGGLEEIPHQVHPDYTPEQLDALRNRSILLSRDATRAEYYANPQNEANLLQLLGQTIPQEQLAHG